MLVVKAKVKEYAIHNGQQLNVSSDFAEALSIKVEQMIKEAAKRAKDNNRTTVMIKDL